MKNYDWPGNIRELRNTMERAILLHNDVVIRPEHLHFVYMRKSSADDAHLCRCLNKDQPLQLGSLTLPAHGLSLEQLKNEIISKALTLNGGNKSSTARYLGITRSKLLTRLKHLQKEACRENSERFA